MPRFVTHNEGDLFSGERDMKAAYKIPRVVFMFRFVTNRVFFALVTNGPYSSGPVVQEKHD